MAIVGAADGSNLTNYGTNNELAVKVWGKKLFVEALKATQLDKFIGTTSDSVIQVRDELNKGPGDRVRFGLRKQLSGAGIQGDADLQGQEESLSTKYDDLMIDQLRHAVAIKGNMSQQRVPFDIRSEAQAGLVDWWAERMDVSFINQLAGNTNQSNSIYSGNNATQAPTCELNHATPGSATNLGDGAYSVIPSDFATGGAVDAATLDKVEAQLADETNRATEQYFDLRMLDKAVMKARTLPTPIRPIKLNGMECYVAFLHPHQVYDLRRNTALGQWVDIQKAAIQGGQLTKNPIFNGAIGMYNNVVLYEDARVPYQPTSADDSTTPTRLPATANGIARGFFCGAQAGAIAFGRAYGFSGSSVKFKWTEVLDDYENKLGVSASLVFGMKKITFGDTDGSNSNEKDFATITLSSFSPGTGGSITGS